MKLPEVELELVTLESLPTMTEAQKEKRRKLLNTRAQLERREIIAVNAKLPKKKQKKSNKKQPKLYSQPCHDIMITMSDRSDLLVPPPDGYGGVYFSKTLRNIEPLHQLRFYLANSPEETEALVTVTFIEPPGPSIRPDLIRHTRCEGYYKIHWTR